MTQGRPGTVIIGASLAGAKAAEALREKGHDQEITLIGDETRRPYERPPLSKEYLQGKAAEDTIFVHDPDWYSNHSIDLRLGLVAKAIDRDRREVILEGNERVGYSQLLLTTGASPRRLPVAGANAENVFYLRRVEDSDRLRGLFGSIEKVVVVGGGWIGLEVAAAARTAGVAVSVVETSSLPLSGVLGPQVAPVFVDLHRDNGVDLRLGVGVQEILQQGTRATGVLLADGARIESDAVIIGVGAAPNTQLAEDAGLRVSDGVVVGSSLRTSDPDIYAAGDVARAFHPLLNTHIRVEHWANALNQPATAARAMLGDSLAAYDQLPFFFTDQYDLGMEYAGYTAPDGYDQVIIRGELDSREFVAFWLSQGRVLAGMNVNIWDINDAIQQLIRSGKQVDQQKLADSTIPLADIANAL